MSKFIAAIELCDNLIVWLNFEKIKLSDKKKRIRPQKGPESEPAGHAHFRKQW